MTKITTQCKNFIFLESEHPFNVIMDEYDEAITIKAQGSVHLLGKNKKKYEFNSEEAYEDLRDHEVGRLTHNSEPVEAEFTHE